MRDSTGISAAGQVARVAAAVQVLVVRARDARHVGEALPPRDLLEEVVGVHDVALDLDALDVGEAAAPDLQRRDLLALEVRAQARRRAPCRASWPISTSRSRPPSSSTVGSLALRDEGPGARRARRACARAPRPASAKRAGSSSRVSSMRHAQLALGVIGLERLADVREAHAKRLAVLVVELLGLDEHLLAHADLAEVVQHAGVLELLERRRREVHVAERPVGQRRRRARRARPTAWRRAASGPRSSDRATRSPAPTRRRSPRRGP